MAWLACPEAIQRAALSGARRISKRRRTARYARWAESPDWFGAEILSTEIWRPRGDRFLVTALAYARRRATR